MNSGFACGYVVIGGEVQHEKLFSYKICCKYKKSDKFYNMNLDFENFHVAASAGAYEEQIF